MDAKERIDTLENYKATLLKWQRTRENGLRSQINQKTSWVQREVLEAGCFKTLTIAPPPAVGGLMMKNINPFDMMFNPPYFTNIAPHARRRNS